MSHSVTYPNSSSLSALDQMMSARKVSAKSDPTAGATSGSGTSTGTSSSSSSVSSLDTTFLSLLVQELQNQDPTAPMDSTAMVGQMISLNQLDQLTSINQTLSSAYPAKTASTGSGSSAGTGTGSGTPSSGASGQVQSGSQAELQSATQAALRMLNASSAQTARAVSPSVTLPAF